jgi:hypothetical protein
MNHNAVSQRFANLDVREKQSMKNAATKKGAKGGKKPKAGATKKKAK